MDSTSAHHQGPASLPSDYALVSSYVHHNGLAMSDQPPLEESTSDTTSAPHNGRPGLPIRRSSAAHRRPSHTSTITMGNAMKDIPSIKNVLPSETTPLLSPNPPVPRIEEPIDRDASLDNESRIKMIREELPILTRYALPVFGSVPPFLCRVTTTHGTSVPICLNIP